MWPSSIRLSQVEKPSAKKDDQYKSLLLIILFFVRAALTDTFYSSGMCLGRLISTFLSTLIKPSSLVIISMLGCIIAVIVLIFLSPVYYIGLYAGVAISGKNIQKIMNVNIYS